MRRMHTFAHIYFRIQWTPLLPKSPADRDRCLSSRLRNPQTHPEPQVDATTRARRFLYQYCRASAGPSNTRNTSNTACAPAPAPADGCKGSSSWKQLSKLSLCHSLHFIFHGYVLMPLCFYNRDTFIFTPHGWNPNQNTWLYKKKHIQMLL